jgi:restriction system protein
LEKRQAARRQAEERRKRNEAKAKDTAERQAKLARTEALKAEAMDRTMQVQERIESLEAILLRRPTGLYGHRTAVEDAFNSRGPEGLVEAIGGALAELPDSEGLRGEWRAAFAPETRELVVEVDLPGQEVVPAVA